MRALRWTLCLALCCLPVASTAAAELAAPETPRETVTPNPQELEEAAPSQIGREIPDFELRDYHGKQYQLSELLGDNHLLVVGFLGTECPLVKLYAPRLQELAAAYADRGVKFVGINSNRQDSVTEVAAFARRAKLEFPVLKDPGNKVADEFAAQRTPEIFVLDADRKVRYHGRVDDQYVVGFQRPSVSRHDLQLALDSLLAGEAVETPVTDAPGCFIGRVPEIESTGEITFASHIAEILHNRCLECHRPGQVAPFSLTDYDEVAGWADTILEVVDAGRMPPWFAAPQFDHFVNDARMTEEEKDLVRRWVADGAPAGDLSRVPEPPQFAEGWRIGEPDAVYHMTAEPVTVQAEGVVDYQHYTVDPGFTEDKWIVAAEARPDNEQVVHHIIVFVQPPGGGSRFPLGDKMITIFAPGMPPWKHPEGGAVHVPAGSKLVFQMHYTPNGTEQQDRSYVGVRFTDPENVRCKVTNGMAMNFGFEIPPNANNHKVESQTKFREDTLLLGLFPHMHLRGKSFRYTAIYPDGTEELLLDVPRYDFNWQLRYDYAEPKLMPKGTRLHCEAWFDNSEENIVNPDPTQPVRFGEQTWEEMMVGFYVCMSAEEYNNAEAQKLREKQSD